MKSEDLSNIEKYAHAAIDDYVLKDIFGKNYNHTRWSQLEKYKGEDGEDTYCKYKEKIKDKVASDNNETMFLWELKNWPFNN